ncbi:hypothetical protein EIK77_000544 [Talaromyces pinophilus]|nr:hypothetical protein EIK77_000544 [Talaromyces pinophilus]
MKAHSLRLQNRSTAPNPVGPIDCDNRTIDKFLGNGTGGESSDDIDAIELRLIGPWADGETGEDGRWLYSHALSRILTQVQRTMQSIRKRQYPWMRHQSPRKGSPPQAQPRTKSQATTPILLESDDDLPMPPKKISRQLQPLSFYPESIHPKSDQMIPVTKTGPRLDDIPRSLIHTEPPERYQTQTQQQQRKLERHTSDQDPDNLQFCSQLEPEPRPRIVTLVSIGLKPDIKIKDETGKERRLPVYAMDLTYSGWVIVRYGGDSMSLHSREVLLTPHEEQRLTDGGMFPGLWEAKDQILHHLQTVQSNSPQAGFNISEWPRWVLEPYQTAPVVMVRQDKLGLCIAYHTKGDRLYRTWYCQTGVVPNGYWKVCGSYILPLEDRRYFYLDLCVISVMERQSNSLQLSPSIAYLLGLLERKQNQSPLEKKTEQGSRPDRSQSSQDTEEIKRMVQSEQITNRPDTSVAPKNTPTPKRSALRPSRPIGQKKKMSGKGDSIPGHSVVPQTQTAYEALGTSPGPQTSLRTHETKTVVPSHQPAPAGTKQIPATVYHDHTLMTTEEECQFNDRVDINTGTVVRERPMYSDQVTQTDPLKVLVEVVAQDRATVSVNLTFGG